MFKELRNESILSFTIETKSPLFIKAGENNQLNPSAADNHYISIYKEGKKVPFIPGTSIKGVFRSSSETFVNSISSLNQGSKPCDCLVYSNSCGSNAKRERTAEDIYRRSCSACKIYGSTALKSRIQFSDAYPIGEYKIGKRTNVAIDRIKGAAKAGALYDMEYVEYGKFKTKIKLQNFFNWQLALILEVIKDINDGFTTFGGLTSKGFGEVKIDDVDLNLRYFKEELINNTYSKEGFYYNKKVDGLENIIDMYKNVKIDKNAIERCEFNEQAL
jgi:CRISPR-associated RAMP protein (TIGR02581 family)